MPFILHIDYAYVKYKVVIVIVNALSSLYKLYLLIKASADDDVMLGLLVKFFSYYW